MADQEEEVYMSGGSEEEEEDQFEDAAPCSPDSDPTRWASAALLQHATAQPLSMAAADACTWS
jgi:hypothetical protein